MKVKTLYPLRSRLYHRGKNLSSSDFVLQYFEQLGHRLDNDNVNLGSQDEGFHVLISRHFGFMTMRQPEEAGVNFFLLAESG